MVGQANKLTEEIKELQQKVDTSEQRLSVVEEVKGEEGDRSPSILQEEGWSANEIAEIDLDDLEEVVSEKNKSDAEEPV